TVRPTTAATTALPTAAMLPQLSATASQMAVTVQLSTATTARPSAATKDGRASAVARRSQAVPAIRLRGVTSTPVHVRTSVLHRATSARRKATSAAAATRTSAAVATRTSAATPAGASTAAVVAVTRASAAVVVADRTAAAGGKDRKASPNLKKPARMYESDADGLRINSSALSFLTRAIGRAGVSGV